MPALAPPFPHSERVTRSIKYFVAQWLRPDESMLARTRALDLQFHIRPRDVIGRHLYRYGVHEADNSSYLLHALSFEPDDLAIDVGANIGWYTCIFDRLMARGGSVLAFEPDPLNYQMLQANLRLNAAARCEALRLALSDRAGTQTLYQYRQTNRGRHSMLPINAGSRIDVPTARLDDVLAERGWTSRRLRFMKIDIEGYELVCLRGAAQTLARCEQLMLEFSPHTMRGAGLNPAELIDRLRTAGFVPHRLRGRAIEPTDWSTLAALDTQVELFLSRNPA